MKTLLGMLLIALSLLAGQESSWAKTNPGVLTPVSQPCQPFGPNDFWYVGNAQGGCNINAGNQVGQMDAIGLILQRVAACRPVVTQCSNGTAPVPFVTAGIDGVNACNGPGKPVFAEASDLELVKRMKLDHSLIQQQLEINLADRCLSPSEMNAVLNRAISLIDGFSNGHVLTNFQLQGLPGLNCGGFWGAMISIGNCPIKPVTAEAHIQKR